MHNNNTYSGYHEQNTHTALTHSHKHTHTHTTETRPGEGELTLIDGGEGGTGY